MTENSSVKRTLVRDLLLYTLFRLVLVFVLFGVLYGIGLLIMDEVPWVPVFLFAIIAALPVSMIVGKKLRTRVNEGAAAVDAQRKARREEFRKRLQGVDE